jgi:hypothetical protein
MAGENFKPYMDTFERDFHAFAVESELQSMQGRTPTIELDGDVVEADSDELRILLDEHMAETMRKMVTE